MLPLAALLPYQHRVFRLSLPLEVLVVKTTVVVVVLTERLAHRPHLERVALVDHEIALVGPQLDTELVVAVGVVTQAPLTTKVAHLGLAAQRVQISAERYQWSTEPRSP
jgi:hypothetical protein